MKNNYQKYKGDIEIRTKDNLVYITDTSIIIEKIEDDLTEMRLPMNGNMEFEIKKLERSKSKLLGGDTI